MAKVTNASTVSFGGTSIGELVSISFKESGAKIDLTNLADTTHVYEVGIKDQECQIEVNGVESTSITVGATASALTISWNGSTAQADALGACVVSDIESSGSLDEKISTSITFVPKDA